MADKSPSFISWIALFLSVIALVLAGFAIFKSEGDARNEIQRQVLEIRKDVSRGLALGEARVRLEALEAQIEAREGYDQARQEISGIRTDLGGAFADARDDLKEEWRQLDIELEQLENSLRAGSADSLQKLQAVLEKLRVKVQPQ